MTTFSTSLYVDPIPSACVAGIAQQLAEIYYIVGAQQLEGYGQVPVLSIIYFHSALQVSQYMYIPVWVLKWVFFKRTPWPHKTLDCSYPNNLAKSYCRSVFLQKTTRATKSFLVLGINFFLLSSRVISKLLHLSAPVRFTFPFTQPDWNLCEKKQRTVATVQMEQHH